MKLSLCAKHMLLFSYLLFQLLNIVYCFINSLFLIITFDYFLFFIFHLSNINKIYNHVIIWQVKKVRKISYFPFTFFLFSSCFNFIFLNCVSVFFSFQIVQFLCKWKYDYTYYYTNGNMFFPLNCFSVYIIKVYLEFLEKYRILKIFLYIYDFYYFKIHTLYLKIYENQI